MAFPNIWHHRRVAETSAKGCDICFKPSASVLVTPEKQDFFYVCPSHLKDHRFATPIVDEAAIAAKKKKKEMDEELERVKKEYEEKQRKKKEKEEQSKSGDKNTDKKSREDKKDDESKPKSDAKAEAEGTTPNEEEPRVFALQKSFYQGRLDKKRQAEVAKRNRERLANPGFFPSVPKSAP